jgi:hypothetical protein
MWTLDILIALAIASRRSGNSTQSRRSRSVWMSMQFQCVVSAPRYSSAGTMALAGLGWAGCGLLMRFSS